MARGAKIYRARVELSHVDRNVYTEFQTTVARHPSETLQRTVMRLLAFCLRYDEGLEFGRGVSTPDEPDLWRREGDGRVIEWIEVGQPDSRRLIKASRLSRRCRLFVFGEGSSRWRKAQLEEMKAPANLAVAHIESDFVDAIANSTDRQFRWSLTVSEGTIFLTAGETTLETAPDVWLGDPLG